MIQQHEFWYGRQGGPTRFHVLLASYETVLHDRCAGGWVGAGLLVAGACWWLGPGGWGTGGWGLVAGGLVAGAWWLVAGRSLGG
jgi:hypothetical protein